MQADLAFGPLMFFLMAITGNAGNDLVSLLPAEDYFKSRKIDVTVEKMMELAGKDPVDGKSSIQQLLALRVLGEDPAKVKKAGGFAANLKILEAIKAGKKAQDKLGFSKEYAAWVVARLTDKQLPLPPPVKKLTESSLDWFPDSVTLVAAMELSSGQAKLGQTKEVRELVDKFVKQIPAETKTEMYQGLEEMGNIRVDRLSFAYRDNPEAFWYRITGKADHKLLTAFFLKVMDNNQQTEKIKGPKNEPITIFPGDRHSPTVALIGDDEFVFGFTPRGNADTPALVKQILEVRSGQKASVLKGKLADEIKKVSDKAGGLVVGSLPADAVRDLGAPRGPFAALPSSFLFEAQRQADGIELRFQGKFARGDDAKTFVQDFRQVRGQALIKLKLQSKDLPFPVDGVLKVLTDVKMEAKENAAAGSLRVSNETVTAIMTTAIKAWGSAPLPAE